MRVTTLLAVLVVASSGWALLDGTSSAVSGQTAAKARPPAKKAKAAPRRPVEPREAQPAQAGTPAPVRDPQIDRSTGSNY